VRVGTLNRHVEKLSGQHIGGADTAADHGSAGSVDTGVRTLCPAKTKLHDTVALSRVYDPGALGSNQALVVDDIQNSSLH